MKNVPLEKYLTLRNVFIFGLVISFGVTLSEVLRDTPQNFKIFAYSTQDFWSGISPYGAHWWRHGLDYFLYAPPFSVLFAPWAFTPTWIGAFAWNLFNYTLLAMAIFHLPAITKDQKSKLLLYIVPLIATSQLSFQYNVAVTYMFLYAFILLENNQGKWAGLVIMLSACTKIYGGFEMLLLLLYPNFWKNAGWACLWAIILLATPLIKLDATQIIPYYQQWIEALTQHKGTRAWETFFDIKYIWITHSDLWKTIVQLTVIMAITGLTLWRRKWNGSLNFKAGVLAIIMGYVVFFSNSAEKHTYIISMAGYLYWYWTLDKRTRIDRTFFWILFVVLCIIPIDLICPPVIMKFIFNTIHLNKILFALAWLYLGYKTYLEPRNKTPHISIQQ